MSKITFEKVEELEDVYLIYPFYSSDDRGYLLKDYQEEIFNSENINFQIKETFYSKSGKNVIRGLHFQRLKPQAKLVRCVCGRIYDVIADLRVNSPTFKQWKGFELFEGGPEIYVPHGFGHGYLVLEDAIVSYKCDEKFYSEYDSGIIWNDNDLNIKWPIEQVEEVILSEKDKKLQTFSQYIDEQIKHVI